VPSPSQMVKTGLDVLIDEKFARLKNLRVGLLGHPASVDASVVHLLTRCLEHKVNVVRLFGPEHGFLGNAQDMEAVGEQIDAKTKLPVVSLYGTTRESLHIKPAQLKDLDVLVCDLQDVGSRYYTFAYTIAFAMQACAEVGITCMVLDRPNPIGGELIEGNDVLPAFKSFVGEYPLANRHGLTLGELALLFKELDHSKCKLEVVWMQNWRRSMLFADTGLPWVLPSPNMPTENTALVYPGACLFEGTNLSEGRGTTRPFELVGAPYIDDPERLVDLAMSCNLPGVTLRPCWFTPNFQKHAKSLCGGLQMHITDTQTFLPLKTSVAILWAARQFKGFAWRTEPYEFVSDRLAIDLLFGDDEPRRQLDAGEDVDKVMDAMRPGQTRFQPLWQNIRWKGYAL
jgi:uncharacterized protein YbbC (DUF1343 family)